MLEGRENDWYDVKGLIMMRTDEIIIDECLPITFVCRHVNVEPFSKLIDYKGLWIIHTYM